MYMGAQSTTPACILAMRSNEVPCESLCTVAWLGYKKQASFIDVAAQAFSALHQTPRVQRRCLQTAVEHDLSMQILELNLNKLSSLCRAA
jgi:hypothetical protein